MLFINKRTPILFKPSSAAFVRIVVIITLLGPIAEVEALGKADADTAVKAAETAATSAESKIATSRAEADKALKNGYKMKAVLVAKPALAGTAGAATNAQLEPEPEPEADAADQAAAGIEAAAIEARTQQVIAKLRSIEADKANAAGDNAREDEAAKAAQAANTAAENALNSIAALENTLNNAAKKIDDEFKKIGTSVTPGLSTEQEQATTDYGEAKARSARVIRDASK